MRISIWGTMIGLVLFAGAGGYVIGRGAVPPVRSEKPWKIPEYPSNVPGKVTFEFCKAPIRLTLREDSVRVQGSTEAVNWFEAEHKAGRLIGREGAEFTKRFELARSIALGPNVFFIELLCMDKPDGHFGIIKLDSATGRISDAEFGEYDF
jgi:hypothetical protein